MFYAKARITLALKVIIITMVKVVFYILLELCPTSLRGFSGLLHYRQNQIADSRKTT